MERNFGISRVLEPRGMVPATAWKLDNDTDIGDREILVEVDKLHIEWDSFQQICNSCNFDENKIKRKIFDIIEKRGKMHNPFTDTGGTLVGTLSRIGKLIKAEDIGADVGDKVYSLTSLCGIPLYLDKITDIDYNYGQIKCEGQAVLFESSPIKPVDLTINEDYTLSAINEAGCLFSASMLAKGSETKNIAVIGRNACTTTLYAEAVKMGNPQSKVIAFIDKNVKENMNPAKFISSMSPSVDNGVFLDFANPVIAYESLSKFMKGTPDFDTVIVAEDVIGAETLAVMATKDKGYIYFTTVKNHYAAAQTVAESFGKDIHIIGFDQYVENYADFTYKVVHSAEKQLKRVHNNYLKMEKPSELTDSRAKSIVLHNAGRNDDFVFQSRVTKHMVDEVLNIAQYDCNVIIQGETGVGKEKILSLIHQNSQRHGNPCIKINCATVHENLAESEFFGYEPGAFTGAGPNGKMGYFEMANNGILFLDEIGSLSMNMQSKLLRVLQENTFYRVGGTKQISVNVRVIVANNVPLKSMVEKGQFREDLFYRLAICNIDVPPLRYRREDISCLAKAFMENWTKKYGIDRELSKEALEVMRKYDWPGNVRELENIVHRLVIGCKVPVVEPEQVFEMLNENGTEIIETIGTDDFNSEDAPDFHKVMEKQERALIEYALKKTGSARKAAEFIGLPQTTFVRKKMKYNL